MDPYDTIPISQSRMEGQDTPVVNDVPAHGFKVGGLSFTASIFVDGKRTA